jgi:hypothetical protein
VPAATSSVSSGTKLDSFAQAIGTRLERQPTKRHNAPLQIAREMFAQGLKQQGPL